MARPNISNAYLIVTHRCNLACRYCFVHQDPSDMPLQVAIDAVDFLANNNPNIKEHRIFFFGGEPLLRFHDLMLPVMEYANRKYPDRKFHFNMTTNGVLMTDEVIEAIHKYNIGVLTSIDGNSETQDYNRPFHNGKGSSEIVEKHVKAYLASGRSSTFRSTVIPETCHNLFDNYLYAKSLGYNNMFFITDAYKGGWDEEHKAILYNQMKKMADYYIDYYKTNNKVFLHINNIERYFSTVYQDILNEAKGIQPTNYITASKCGYGQNSNVAIGTNGDLYGCQELVTNEGKKNEFWIGNIYTGVDEDRRQALLDLFWSKEKSGDMECIHCPARSICNGGCSSANHVLTGYLNTCTPSHCNYYRHSYIIAKYIVQSLETNEAFKKEFLMKRQNNNCNNCQVCQNENVKKENKNVSRTVQIEPQK